MATQKPRIRTRKKIVVISDVKLNKGIFLIICSSTNIKGFLLLFFFLVVKLAFVDFNSLVCTITEVENRF